MVNYSSDSLDRSFRALSDPTRRTMLALIAKGDLTVGDLAEPFNMYLAAVSKHLQVLERAKFIKKTKSGRIITCRATLEPLTEMNALLEDLGRYWNSQLDSLENYLETELTQERERHGTNKKRISASSGNKKGSTSKKREGI